MRNAPVKILRIAQISTTPLLVAKFASLAKDIECSFISHFVNFLAGLVKLISNMPRKYLKKKKSDTSLVIKDSWLQRSVNVPFIPRLDYLWSDSYPRPLFWKINIFFANFLYGMMQTSQKSGTSFALPLLNTLVMICVVTCTVYRNYKLVNHFQTFTKDLFNSFLSYIFSEEDYFVAALGGDNSRMTISAFVIFLSSIFLSAIPKIFFDISPHTYKNVDGFSEIFHFSNIFTLTAILNCVLAMLIVYYIFHKRKFETVRLVPNEDFKKFSSISALIQGSFVTQMVPFLMQLHNQPLGYLAAFLTMSAMVYFGVFGIVLIPYNTQIALFTIICSLTIVCTVAALALGRFLWMLTWVKWNEDIREYKKIIEKELDTIVLSLRRGFPSSDRRDFGAVVEKVSRLRKEAFGLITYKLFKPPEVETLSKLLTDKKLVDFTANSIETKPRPENCCIS